MTKRFHIEYDNHEKSWSLWEDCGVGLYGTFQERKGFNYLFCLGFITQKADAEFIRDRLNELWYNR